MDEFFDFHRMKLLRLVDPAESEEQKEQKALPSKPFGAHPKRAAHFCE
jgi:hypothetical protein